MPTGADLFIASLKKLGVTHIFTLVGDHLNEILRVADREGFTIVDTRHESAAVHMADGWGRITRTPGVSMVTGAPGHTNSITGIATAYYTGSPLLAMSGMSSSKLRDRFAFQDMDQLAQVQGITKYAAVPADTGQIPFHVYRAFLEAMTGRSGPTHLSVPVDLLTAQVETHFPLPRGPVQIRRPGPEPTDLNQAIDLLENAERPVVVAGSGAWWADAGAELQAFIEQGSLPLFTVGLAKGLVSDEHPLCFGYADPTLNRGAETALQRADVILVIGKKLDYRLRMGGPQLFSQEAKLIQIDVHGPELGLNRRVEVGLVADAKLALRDLVEAFRNRPQPDRSSWLAEVGKARRDWQEEVEAIAKQPSEPMHPLHFFREMLPWLPGDATLCWDGGNFVHWGRNYTPARKPMHWLRLGGLAGLGVCLPIGLAAQIARPNARSIVITGDGSLGFYLGELDTAVRFNLPVIIIVGNDGGWGVERELQLGSFGDEKTVACELRRTRYDLVMKAFGGDGEFVERREQIRPALDRALRSDKPFLINVDIKGCASPFTDYQLRRKK